MTDWNWHKATTLDERAHRRAQAENSGRGIITERGRKRLAKWKAQPPFDAHPLLRQRFEQAGLTEAEFLELLSDEGDAILPKNVEKPDWAREIEQALTAPREQEVKLYSDKADSRPELLFLELVRPMVGRAGDRLRQGMQALAEAHAGVPFALDRVERLCLGVQSRRLRWLLMRTMALELNVARVQGLLHGLNGEERFASFINRIRQPEVRLELFREYPVLARLVVTILDDWVNCSLEVLERWCADMPLIQRVFSPGQDPGPLVSIEGDAGDGHRGGRTVWILECSSGFKIVYKPKSMAVDAHFQELLDWLNERGFSAPFHPIRVLDRGDYGWEEFVSPGRCSSRDEVARFYVRSGGYAALLYALAATDFHNENVLAMGEHPILIDLEALFHPSGLEPAPEHASEIAANSFGDSVLGSGLLPVPVWGGRESGAYDLSGLGSGIGQKMPMRMPGWNRKGTDEMQFVREGRTIESSDHRPTLNGAEVSPLDYLDEMENGFRQVYRLLEKHRDELLAEGGLLDRFADDEVRVVLRDSTRYAELLQEGSHPDALRDGLDRDRLFDRLWDDVVDRPRLAQLIPAEVEDLWRCDIPLFSTRPGSRDIWASKERCFPNALNESGLDRARQRMEQFGAADLKRQLWFLRGSLTTLASSRRARPRMQLESEPGVNIESTQLIAASCAVGDRLWEMALRGADDVTWIGLNLAGEKQWMLAPLGLDFYDGLPGIVFFLAYLGAVSGKERYTSLARAGLETVRRRIEPSARKKGFKAIGGFVGWGGLLYMLTHLGVLWGEPDLLAEAEELVEELPKRVEEDKSLDVIAGAAGCIGALLSLDWCRPSRRVLEVANQCGEHLLIKARRMPQGLGWPAFGDVPLAGFSHGAAGIAWALLELATASGEERFRTAALAAIAYERSLFSVEAGNWMDLRPPETEAQQAARETPQFPVAWCHGAPGIGLSRLLCGRRVNDPHFKAEIDTALRTTLADGFGYNHCLCHGDLGNLEFLMEAGRSLPESAWGHEARRLAAAIVNSITREGWLCGNPLALESPGLMTGLAGIGYGLLRCAEPARVPSVLALAPPVVTKERTTVTKRCEPNLA